MTVDGPLTANTSLLCRVSQRDTHAWRALTKIYGPLVYSWARQAGVQDSDAANLVQDVFLTVHKSLDPQREGRFRHWLWRVYRSRLMDHYREAKKRPDPAGGSTMNMLIQGIPEEPLDENSMEGRRELTRMRERAILSLKDNFKPQVWEAFWRTAVSGDESADVAEDLGISVWAVYKARSRVLQKLRTELEGLDISIEEPA